MADAGLTSLEADYIEAQTRLVKALTSLRLAQEQHARMFGPDAYREALDRLASMLGPSSIVDQA